VSSIMLSDRAPLKPLSHCDFASPQGRQNRRRTRSRVEHTGPEPVLSKINADRLQTSVFDGP
jgi:hypothetical protein